jgi:hypothetical protein
MVNQNVQEALKFQENKNKEYEKTQKTNKWTHRSPKKSKTVKQRTP